MQTLFILLVVAIFIFIICFSIASIIKEKEIKEKRKQKKKVKGIINNMNQSEMVKQFAGYIPNENLVKIFNRAKNPWRMTVATFQFIRYFGLLLFTIVAICLIAVGMEFFIFSLGMGILCFWYPMYFYRETGNEREAEWNKVYEFIWVLKHNLMLYDVAKAFMNVKLYIKDHAPHNKEIIQGFDDFYKYWNTNEIDPYIERFYPFSVTREIYQIAFNMNKTGEFPEESLNSLRSFIINAQNLTVEKTLSGVSGQATIYSLPFLMISVIVALMIPLVFQLLKFI